MIAVTAGTWESPGIRIGGAVLDDAARGVVTSGIYGHLVTLDPDGGPQVTLAWFDLDDDLVFATLFNQRKLDNLRRDPRAAVSFESVGGVGPWSE